MRIDRQYKKLPLLGLRLSIRFILPIALVMGLLALAVVPLVDTLNMRWSIRDLNLRAQLVADTLQEPLVDLLERKNRKRLHALFDQAVQDERLYALAFCDTNHVLVERTLNYPSALGCTPQLDNKGISKARSSRTNGLLHVTIKQLMVDGHEFGSLIMAHDISFIEHRAEESRSYVLGIFFVLGIMITAITVLVANLSWRNWMRGVRSMLNPDSNPHREDKKPSPDVLPLLGDVRKFLGDISHKRNIRDHLIVQWKPETLRQLLRDQLYGDEIIVVSNREPYIHNRKEHGIEVQRPASGLVTAVEPVMRACSGTWIAHGVGSADRETVDKHDRVRVPPDDPGYTLRRIWLSEEEERGYYYGFANEGLWPLCHIAHVRPSFRASDWDQYYKVNQHFADAVVAEATTRDPVVLVQDYHFALLPKMIRERLPRATIITFWHIPWPNPESFGICPWRNEILEGLLGSTILGFHTAYHCKNFIETVDRFLETRIERETSTISYRSELTMVQDYPISIQWPDVAVNQVPFPELRQSMRQRLGIGDEQRLALGVDRLDYTKGIIERFEAVERLLEKYPAWAGRFILIQIAAPSRSLLQDYQNFEQKVRESAARINSRFGNGDYQPIRLFIEQHSSASVNEHYRACDICMVTSLHDGMNLVAKEFIAARDDEGGVLILSQFAGAAGELREALVVNPYDLEETAAALHIALTMPRAEQRERMRSLRNLVRDFNIYRWAGRMLLDASALRQRARIRERIFGYRSRYAGTLQ